MRWCSALAMTADAVVLSEVDEETSSDMCVFCCYVVMSMVSVEVDSAPVAGLVDLAGTDWSTVVSGDSWCRIEVLTRAAANWAWCGFPGRDLEC